MEASQRMECIAVFHVSLFPSATSALSAARRAGVPCVLALALAGCGGGDGDGSDADTAPLPTTVQATGTVVDDQGVPLADATVKVLSASTVSGTSQTVQSDANGQFSVTLDVATPAVLRVDKAGYARGFAAAAGAASNAQVAARVVLLPVASTQVFDSTQAAVLRVPGSAARVALAAGSLVRTDGQAVSGAATAQLTPIDPSKNISLMPGLLVDATSRVPIESLGALSVTLTDATGAPLNLASGQTATIRIPATPAAGATGPLPATFPLYHLNETTGLWTQEGSATLQTDPVTGHRYYEGTVSHFSVWNADQPLSTSSVDLSMTIGGATCTVPAGTRAVSQGVDYNGTSVAEGNKLSVRASSQVRILLVDRDDFVMDAVDLASGVAGGAVRVPRCLVSQPTVTLSGRVTVTSGALSNHRVQISGELIKTVTLPIRPDGSYAVAVAANRGVVRARLVSVVDRGAPDTDVSATVAAADVSLPDLTVQDTRFAMSACVQGWSDYRQSSVQVSVFRGAAPITAPQTLQSTGSGEFALDGLPFNTTLTIRLTPPSGQVAEKDVPLVVAGAPATLPDCLILPVAPHADMQVTGTGLSRSFGSTGSTAGEGRRIVSTTWRFGDGSTATGATANHTFAAAGSYEVTLQLTDDVNQVTELRRTVELVSADQVLSTLTPITALAAGTRHTCAVRSDSVWCWGINDAQQLGSKRETVINGDTIIESGLMSSGVPLRISGLSPVTAVSAGDTHSCVLHANGAVSCWGAGESGQLGNNSSASSALPVAVSNLTTAVALGAGTGSTCALLQDSSVQCWGRLSGVNQPVPAPVPGLNGVRSISVGSGHRCAVLVSGAVRCWGSNDNGQLGNNTTTASATPVDVVGISTAVAVVAGARHSCALLADGTVNCWGYRGISGSGGTVQSGLMGDGGTGVTPALTPVPVAGLSTVKALAAGPSHTCALLQDDTVSCWGRSGYARGQSDPNSVALSPVPLGASGAVNAIALGQGHTCL